MENADQKLKEILEQIKENRCRYNYSQDFMASGIGISQSAYSKLEKGKIPLNLHTFIKITELMRVDFEKWFEKSPDEMVMM